MIFLVFLNVSEKYHVAYVFFPVPLLCICVSVCIKYACECIKLFKKSIYIKVRFYYNQVNYYAIVVSSSEERIYKILKGLPGTYTSFINFLNLQFWKSLYICKIQRI